MQPSVRRIFVAVLMFSMSAPLFAQSSLGSDKSKSTPKPPQKTKTKPAAAAPTVKDEVKALRDLVTAQQQQLQTQNQQVEELKDQIQQLIKATQQANANAQKVQSSADEAQSAATQAQQSATEAQKLATQASDKAGEAKTALAVVETKTKDEDKKIGSLQDILGRFRLNGDIRVRGESFFQDGVSDRNRGRIRVRFGVEGKLNEDFIGGVALATGSLGDPTTTNETFTNFFDRKTIGLDKGYITFNPAAAKWLSLTGGKFVYTWQRTQVTGDPDINPEGFTEKVSWDLKTPVFKNVSFHSIQYLYNEASAGTDSYALGGQVSTKLQLGPLTSTPSFLLLKWNNPDAILQASAFAVQSTTTTGGLPVPGEGPGCGKGTGLPTVPPCAFSANGMTNATYNDAGGKPHFYSQFLYADLILNNQMKTRWSRLPFNALLEYENNLDAKDHPLDAGGNVLTDLGKQSHTYLVDFSLGQTKNKNDIQFGYAWLREEQDAALASFAESDQRAPTNIVQNRWYVLWKLQKNTVASYTFWYGRTLNSALRNAILVPGTTAGQDQAYLKRMQFDLVYSF